MSSRERRGGRAHDARSVRPRENPRCAVVHSTKSGAQVSSSRMSIERLCATLLQPSTTIAVGGR